MKESKTFLKNCMIAVTVCCTLVCNFVLVASASAEGKSFCFPVHASTKGELTMENCASPVGFCVTGRITRGSFLNSKTFFTVHSVAVAAGMPGFVPDTTSSYVGTLEILTRFGDVNIEEVGVSDSVTGAFSEIDRVVGGTRWFANASGNLFLVGNATADGTGFTSKIRGKICLSH